MKSRMHIPYAIFRNKTTNNRDKIKEKIQNTTKGAMKLPSPRLLNKSG